MITQVVSTNGELQNFIITNLRMDFANLKADDAVPMDRFVVLGQFNQSATNDEGETVQCQGFIASNKMMLDNIQLLHVAQPDGLVLYLDGTYKLLDNGWVLILLGGVTLNVSAYGECSHSFVPILHCLTRSECEPAFAAVFKTFTQLADEYAGIILKIDVVMQDHCQASANALKNTLRLLTFQVELIKIITLFKPKVL